ncbi:hypothetical protein ACFPPD_10190 [Cohnella suwonensis]|uniref:Uncharacterized protein n=1 Tax=Cohnella suwonensis TaxID=696072 RepID=A0ABW0LUU3_9BACL
MNLEVEMKKSDSIRQGAHYWKRFKRQWPLHLFVGMGMLFLLIFAYTPMFGIIMAFKNYKIVDGIHGIFTSEWVGFKQLKHPDK